MFRQTIESINHRQWDPCGGDTVDEDVPSFIATANLDAAAVAVRIQWENELLSRERNGLPRPFQPQPYRTDFASTMPSAAAEHAARFLGGTLTNVSSECLDMHKLTLVGVNTGRPYQCVSGCLYACLTLE